MQREFSPQQKTGIGRYLLIFAGCIAAFWVIENILPGGLHTAPLVFLVFAAAAFAMYRMLKTNYSRCEFVLTDEGFFVTTAIGHKERINLSLPLKNIKKLYGKNEIPGDLSVSTEVFGAEGEGYSAILFYDETLNCEKLAKFSVSDDFYRAFSEKMLDKRESL